MTQELFESLARHVGFTILIDNNIKYLTYHGVKGPIIEKDHCDDFKFTSTKEAIDWLLALEQEFLFLE